MVFDLARLKTGEVRLGFSENGVDSIRHWYQILQTKLHCSYSMVLETKRLIFLSYLLKSLTNFF
jgi:hypothetical protein